MDKKHENSKVLIIDDLVSNLSLIVNILSYSNIETFVAKSGKQALEIIKTSPPDLILLDIMMPEMNGFELCEILKENRETKDIPIIFLTARNDLEATLKGLELGAVDYIVKPVQSLELVKRVSNHLELKRARDMLEDINKNLESKIQERTHELQKEIEEKKRTESILKESEEKFRNIFNNSYDGITISDTEGNILEVNQPICKILGYSRDEMLQKTLFDISTITLQKNRDEILKEIANSSFIIYETEIITKNGKKIPFEVSSRTIKFNGKNSILSVRRDITERKLAERKILKTIIETEEKERKRFARDLHDGLGSLLSGVNMYLGLLQHKEVSEKKKNDILKNSSELLSTAIESARNIANNIKPHLLGNYGLEEALKSIFQKMSKNGEINIDFQFQLNDFELKEEVEVIFFRIINELITNTIKYAQADNIQVLLTARKERITLIYTDDGDGFVVKDALKNEDSGMGLQNIFTRVKSIQGTCEMKSELGKGTKTIITVNT